MDECRACMGIHRGKIYRDESPRPLHLPACRAYQHLPVKLFENFSSVPDVCRARARVFPAPIVLRLLQRVRGFPWFQAFNLFDWRISLENWILVDGYRSVNHAEFRMSARGERGCDGSHSRGSSEGTHLRGCRAEQLLAGLGRHGIKFLCRANNPCCRSFDGYNKFIAADHVEFGPCG